MITIKPSGSMRRKIKKNHPYKRHCPNLFKSTTEAIDRYIREGYAERSIKSMKKSGLGPVMKPC